MPVNCSRHSKNVDRKQIDKKEIAVGLSAETIFFAKSALEVVELTFMTNSRTVKRIATVSADHSQEVEVELWTGSMSDYRSQILPTFHE
jgi:hypothetical protein